MPSLGCEHIAWEWEHRKRLEMESDLLARKISQAGYEEDKSRTGRPGRGLPLQSPER